MIKIITGVMGSGKTERLIEEIEKCDQSYLVLKPSTDTRNGAFVKTRAHNRTHPAVLIDESNPQVLDLLFTGMNHYDFVFIDEVQFFSKPFIEKLVFECFWSRTRIVASGLTKDFKGEAFPSMRTLWSKTKDVEILKGHCFHCGNDKAMIDVMMDKFDTILTEGESVQIEGETKNHYETLCPPCHEVLK
jgi:thymidine kinase